MSISVPEMMMVLLLGNAEVVAEATGGIIVGPPSTAEMRSGVVSLAPTGLAKNERDLPLVKVNMGVRSIAASAAKAELLATKVREALHEQGRKVVQQSSNSESYLIHYCSVTGGPSLAAGPVEDVWEVNQTIEVYAGTEAVA